MSDLPAKQSAFSRICNNIVNAGLKNKFTRNIMANIPGIFGYSLTRYVLNNDNQDFDLTFELLASMKSNAVKSNFSSIMRAVRQKINESNDDVMSEMTEKFINKILDAVDHEVAELVSLMMIDNFGNLHSLLTSETCKRIADTIDCRSKTQAEMNDLFELSEKGPSEKIAFNLFGNLTAEQKKEYFPKFVFLIYGRECDLSKLFEQFPEDDRLEQYKKILDVYKDEKIRASTSIRNLSECFRMLSEDERVSVLEETFEQTRNMEDHSKGLYLLSILSSVPVEEQRKYHKEVLEHCNTGTQIYEYVSSVDKTLQRESVLVVINKIREMTHKANYYYIDTDILSIINKFDSEVINNAFLTILKGNVDDPNMRFVLALLSKSEIKENLELFAQNKSIITREQYDAIKQIEYNVDEIAILFFNTECNRILNEYINNPGKKTYTKVIEEIAELAKNVKFNEASTYEVILEKKTNTYLQLFSNMDDNDREVFFKNTLNAILESSQNLSYKLGDNLKILYGLLNNESQILQFPNLVSAISEKYGGLKYVSEFIDNLVQTTDSGLLDSIYSQYINMFSEGIESENFKKARYALISDQFTDGLIEKTSKDEKLSFLTEDELKRILVGDDKDITKIVRIFVETRLNKIKNKYNNLPEDVKLQNIDKVLIELATSVSLGSSHFSRYADELKIAAIDEMFSSIDKEEKGKHFNALYVALDSIEDAGCRKNGYLQIFRGLEKEEKKQRFSEFFEHLKNNENGILELYDLLENDNKASIFENYIMSSPENLKFAAEILNKYSIKQLNEIFKGKLILDEKTIIQLMTLKDNIAMKTLLFDKDVDREKIIDLSSYEQLQKNGSIDINSVIKNLYEKNQGKSKQEFNQLLEDTYNLFTYNNVPEFMKNFRIFQLGSFYNVENKNIKSFEGKTNKERDSLILEDLFKISLDSNNESLREFANIILIGKQLCTRIQSNPEEKIKTLSIEEIALLNQYRDTLFDLHNLTKEIRDTDRPRIEKTGDVIRDLRTLITIYSDNKEHNPNSRNIVFNPNKILDELFDGFITTTIRPKAILEYMDRIKSESDERHLRIEEKLRDGTMHLEVGDFVKGIRDFDDYLPSMLRDGVKGGEFNQEHSHSDFTPLDADFGYITKANLTKEGATDYGIISTTISAGYGDTYIVLKNYAERLQDRRAQSFDRGTFTGSPDYYAQTDSDEAMKADRYIRTGIPVTDIDYIVSIDWNPKNGYEMAMAGIYIPVINPKGEIVFSSEEYRRIREEMRGLSHYNADSIVVSKDASNMEALYAIYRSISTKTPEEIDTEIETVRGLVVGKLDTVTEQKKKATTKFIKDFFTSQGIRVTDDLSQNLATKSVELIDTGSTGRGTNVPGDGDFDFMLRHNLPPEIIIALSDKVRELVTPESKFITVGDGFRSKDIVLPTGETVDIDVTTAKKSLKLSYSSDMCVRDRLKDIKDNNPESYNYVKANIIMAKKILKAKGIYKKLGSDGATEHGGFGGIGVENWILQNGGSFKQAIDTFLEAANEVGSYDEFKNKYPIFDFGFNHREGKIRHDRFSAFLANVSDRPDIGFEYVKATLTEIQKAMELETQKQEARQIETPLMRSISPEGFEEAGAKKDVLRTTFSYDAISRMVAKHRTLPESDIVHNSDSAPDFEEV